MSLTAAQRAKKNRENASKSTGPTSDAGKAKSRLNAVKHGLRAEVLVLPNEDRAEVEARSQAWNEYYQPQSPAAHHLVNQCVRATLLSDRVDRYHAAALSKQVRDAEAVWEDTKGDRVGPLAKLLATDPAHALPALKQSARGCRYLIGCWKALAESFEEDGWWNGKECEEVTHLMGVPYVYAALSKSSGAWAVALFNQICQEEPEPDVVAKLLEPDHKPDLLGPHFDATNLPDPATAARMILGIVDEEIERLETALTRLDSAPCDPSRDEALDLAMILRDAPSSRLFLRYHSEARTSFHRAYSELVKTLARDAEELAEAQEIVRSEADSPPSPNEANSASEASENPGNATTSDSPPAPESAPAPAPERVETPVTVAAQPTVAFAGVKTRLVGTA